MRQTAGRIIRFGCWTVAAAAVMSLMLPAGAGEEKAEAPKKPAVKLSDYYDFKQMPIRSADVLRMMGEADLILEVSFDPRKVKAAEEGETRWKVKPERTRYKGKAGKQLTIVGDPKAFNNPTGGYVSGGTFTPQRKFIVFLEKEGEEENVYRCVEGNPGGFRNYRGRAYDHRSVWVGKVNGRIVVEGGPGYRGASMSGPRMLEHTLRAIGKTPGLKLTARALGGAAVEVSIENTSDRAVNVPETIALRAPVLWAEIEGPEQDSVLLTRDDYLMVKAENPYEKKKVLKKGDAPLTFKVELPTGSVPEGASLIWAQNNNRKPYAGSLPEGKHKVRMLFHVAEDTVVISNPVEVEGKAGGARPEDVAKLPGTAKYVPKTVEKKDSGEFRKEDLKGEIWFQSNRDKSWDIFVMNADGSNVRNVTNTKDRDEWWPRPSPDGKRVVFMVGRLKKLNIWEIKNPKKKEIWIMDRDGKNQKKITENATRPSWGPDGKAIVYTQQEGRKTGPIVYHVDTGKAVNPIEKWKSWLRAGGEAIFATSKKNDRMLAIGGKLWTTTSGVLMVMHLDENYEPMSLKPMGTGYFGCNPQWSSTGERLYFAHHDPKHKGGIILWSMKPDGTDPRRFETPTKKAWGGYGIYCESPDGQMFLYNEGRDLAVMRLADGAKVKLTNKQGSNGAAWWHPGVQGE